MEGGLDALSSGLDALLCHTYRNKDPGTLYGFRYGLIDHTILLGLLYRWQLDAIGPKTGN